MKQRLATWVEQGWYGTGKRLLWLLPLSALVARVARQRLLRFREQALVPPVPVLVVGNITVGGTGKTPLVEALCAQAAHRGLTVAIISRGYGANPPHFPWRVTPEQTASVAGDEPLMLAQKTQMPVFIAPERDAALRAALASSPDVVISDDGLQHYALPRSAEIIVLDAKRWLGNGRCLPAGPLREPAQRLNEVDWVVVNGVSETSLPKAITMVLEAGDFWQPSTGVRLSPESFVAKHPRVHAVAGIGHPERFFTSLQALGLAISPHAFADHHPYTKADLSFAPAHPIVMTDKDAVKAAHLVGQQAWVFSIKAKLPETFFDAVFNQLLKESST